MYKYIVERMSEITKIQLRQWFSLIKMTFVWRHIIVLVIYFSDISVLPQLPMKTDYLFEKKIKGMVYLDY